MVIASDVFGLLEVPDVITAWIESNDANLGAWQDILEKRSNPEEVERMIS